MYSKEFYQPSRPNLDTLNESIQRGVQERFGYANVMYQRLVEEIADFESHLNPDEEMAAYFASFGKEIYLQIESISYRDPYYIIFSGTTDQGQKARIVQHISQTSILFVPGKVKSDENRKPRRFGFSISAEKE
ncbi:MULTISPECIES: DUF6173 family protein [Dolichospermum]|jgi:hypothetical protein|uniref:Uncharacterized protein n=1 Tax=Dolichospermum flos-aquae CCAP 1403/13F TaxID=315271 RepID=A0A6H2C510_DOLFA|nr:MULTISPECIES: DUF6173 family protein [Dolichospermum]MBO1052522.1 hypothetical protein [Dolichospermum sp. DET73]MTJ19007.1 hypothetical protein [Dolichospermum sp. UHCC 0299]MTJ40537.1 hypothetical protein [Dolichospermum sp. UHCC 0406]QJB46411.1 hypothetical protein HGD76_21735 [Dolichospermum flos-aquae CCAP 1403/13F]